MSYIGRKIRMRHLLFPDVPTGLIVPIDHGLTMGPIRGIESLRSIERWINDENISAIVTHKGMLENLIVNEMLSAETGIILHLNGMPGYSIDANNKQMVTQVEAALRLGADAVSVQVNFGEENYAHNIDILAQVTDQAQFHGLPVLAMVYDKTGSHHGVDELDRLGCLIRLASEMGCDAIKVAMPPSTAQVNRLLQYNLEGTKIFFAGGELIDENKFCRMAQFALAQGASGLCAGRNVFQHDRPEDILRRLAQLIRNTPHPRATPVIPLQPPPQHHAPEPGSAVFAKYGDV